MPIPKPKSGENQDGYVERFMDDDSMCSEFPDPKERTAVCFKTWREAAETGVVNITEDFREIAEDVQVGTVKRLEDGKGFVIENVALLSEFSKNKGPSGKTRRYTRREQEKSLLKFEGLEINVDHSILRPGGSRGILEKIGIIRNPSLRTIVREDLKVTQTIGDMHLIDVPESDHIVKLIEMDSTLGASSISARGDFKITREHDEVENLDPKSLDIVGRGGTTRGLFEGLHADDKNKDGDKGKNTGHNDPETVNADSSKKITAEANSFTDAAGQRSDSQSHLDAMFAHYRAAGNLYFAGDPNRARAHVGKAADHEIAAKNLAKQEPDAQSTQFPAAQDQGKTPPKPVEGDSAWVSLLYEDEPSDWVEVVYK